MLTNLPDVSSLKRIRNLSQFSDEQLQSLANRLTVMKANPGDLLIDIGCTDEYSLYVLQGEIISLARDGASKTVQYGSEEDLTPVAQLRPSMYKITAKGPAEYLKIDKQLLNEFAHQVENDEEDISLNFIEDDHQEHNITVRMFQDLLTDQIVIPSLPEVAHKIQQVFSDENTDSSKVAAILLTDPAISAKLIKVANSPLYSGLAMTESLQSAIVRLGMDSTYKLVMAHVTSELFNSAYGELTEYMKKLWSHSRKVAAISRILSRETGLFDPDQAMLAGLTHDLGVILIVKYLQDYDEPIETQEIEATINLMRRQITGLLMRKWNFSYELVTVGEESEDWFRNPSDEPDLCDLVLVGQYHSAIGTSKMASMPPINKIPAMSKLKMGVEDSLELIKSAQQEIAEIERLLL